MSVNKQAIADLIVKHPMIAFFSLFLTALAGAVGIAIPLDNIRVEAKKAQLDAEYQGKDLALQGEINELNIKNAILLKNEQITYDEKLQQKNSQLNKCEQDKIECSREVSQLNSSNFGLQDAIKKTGTDSSDSAASALSCAQKILKCDQRNKALTRELTNEKEKKKNELADLNTEISALKKIPIKMVPIEIKLTTAFVKRAGTVNTISLYFTNGTRPEAIDVQVATWRMDIAGALLPKNTEKSFKSEIPEYIVNGSRFLNLVNQGTDCWFPQKISIIISGKERYSLNKANFVKGRKAIEENCLQSFDSSSWRKRSYIQYAISK